MENVGHDLITVAEKSKKKLIVKNFDVVVATLGKGFTSDTKDLQFKSSLR